MRPFIASLHESLSAKALTTVTGGTASLRQRVCAVLEQNWLIPRLPSLVDPKDVAVPGCWNLTSDAKPR